MILEQSCTWLILVDIAITSSDLLDSLHFKPHIMPNLLEFHRTCRTAMNFPDISSKHFRFTLSWRYAFKTSFCNVFERTIYPLWYTFTNLTACVFEGLKVEWWSHVEINGSTVYGNYSVGINIFLHGKSQQWTCDPWRFWFHFSPPFQGGSFDLRLRGRLKPQNFMLPQQILNKSDMSIHVLGPLSQ